MTDVEIVRRLARDLSITLPKRDRGAIDPWSQSPGYTVDQFGHVVDLNLYGLGLPTCPSIVFELENLKLLDLGENGLTELPERIGCLVHLETLNLGNNSLTSIPSAIGNLRSLRRLILWGNQLVALPRELARLSALEVFNAFNNPIEYPPQDVLSEGVEHVLEFLKKTPPDTTQSRKQPSQSVRQTAAEGVPQVGERTPSNVRMPLGRFDGFLKQITRNSLGSAAQIALDKAFPGFWPADPSSEHFEQQRVSLQRLGVDHVFADVNSPRRLAGCWGLPKGRYYTLCSDEAGDDANTLVNELNAYLDPLHGGLCLFGDMGVPQTAVLLESQFGISAAPGHYLLCVFVGRPGAPSPVISAMEQRGLVESSDQTKEPVRIGVEIPYAVHHSVIDDVFDLRLPECQEYVVEEFFKKDTSSLRKPHRSGIERFVDTLPVLMHPARGGGPQSEGTGAILQALAAFVRINGAQALVFPSARSDVLVEIKERKLTQWRGWCLVDYRNAPPPIIAGSIDISEGWPVTFPKGATIRVADNDEYRDSFEVNGIVAWGRARVGELESEFIGGKRS